jgi:hypothetical protein
VGQRRRARAAAQQGRPLPDAEQKRVEVERVAPGVPVCVVAAKPGEGLAALEPWLLPGRTVVLLGSSGVGKSTLVNRLLGREKQKTREVIESADQRGRHTTTHRELIELPGGALLIDTPGLRELAAVVRRRGPGRGVRGRQHSRRRLPLQRLRPRQRARLRGARGGRGRTASTPRGSTATSSCRPSCARSRSARTR